MRKDVRQNLEMAVRARDFSRSHPSSGPIQVVLLTVLEELLRRADSLAIRERAGRLEELAAAHRRKTLRQTAQFKLMQTGEQPVSDALIDELHVLKAEFLEAIASGKAARAEHHRAGKELKAVGEEAARIVAQLHGLNRYRFRKDPALLAAWEAVRFGGPQGGGVAPAA